MPQERAIAARERAMRRACSSLSRTQGPAMNARDAPPPTARSRAISTRRVPWRPRSALGLPELLAGTDKAPEERVGEHRLRLEFGMELAGQEVRMIRNLHDLDETPIGGLAAHPEPLLQHGVEVLPVDFVAVAVPLADLGLPVGALGLRPRLQDARPLPETHVPPHPLHALELAQLVDHRVRGPRIELGGTGALQAAPAARELNNAALH